MEFGGLDPQASQRLEALYREHVDEVLSFCARVGLGDQAWAEDRTQEVFIVLANNLHKLSDIDSLGGWLRRVAMNTCMMNLRRRSRWWKVDRRLRSSEPPGDEGPEHTLRHKRDAWELKRSIEALPLKLRAVVTLVYVMDYSQAEVASILDLSRGEVSKRHAKALAELRRMQWEFSDG